MAGNYLDALFGRFYANGIEQELVGGINVKSPLTATVNNETGALDVSLDADATGLPSTAAYTTIANPTGSSAVPVETPLSEIVAVNVASASALRAANPNIAKIAVMAGAGGGQFYWDPSSADTDDGVLTVEPSGWSGNGRWKRLLSDVVFNVKWFGAKGDDTADDLDAFNMAMASLPASGGAIYVPAGTYYLSKQLDTPDKPIVVIGQGKDLTTLRGPASSENALDLGEGNIRIEGVRFTGWNHVLRYSDGGGVANVEILRCQFDNNTGRALSPINTTIPISNLRCEGCHVKDHSGAGAGGFIVNSSEADDIVIQNNVIENLSSSTAGVSGVIVGANVGDGDLMTNILINNNLIRNISAAGEAHAILAYGARVLVTGNRIDTVETSSGDCEAIYTKARMGLIAGNSIRNGGSPSGGAIQVKGSTRSNPDGTPAGYTMRILHNMIVDDRTGANGYGISAHRGDLDISHNVIEGTEESGIYLAPVTVEGVSITDNELIGIRGSSSIEIRNQKRFIHVARNRIHGMPNGEGIRVQIATNPGVASDIVIESNFIYDFVVGRGITLVPTTGTIERITIKDNIIDCPGPQRGVQVSAPLAENVYDLVCVGNRYIDVDASPNLHNTSSSSGDKFPVIRDYSSNDRTSFFGADPVTKPEVTGSADGNAALVSLLAALEKLGIITDSST